MTVFKTQSAYPMIAFEEALAILDAHIVPLEARAVPLDELASGMVLAEAVLSPEAIPPFPASTMDGYAVSADDASSRRRVLGEQEAGHHIDLMVAPGECTRIMTGAPLPRGANAVIPVEYTREEQGWMISDYAVQPRQNVRPEGSDVRAGQQVLEANAVLGPAEIGVLAALGLSAPRVYPSPRVVILTTGDELAAPDVAPKPGQIRDSNSFTLAAAIRAVGCQVVRRSQVADSFEALRAAIERAVEEADLVLSSGGVSMGTRDLIKPVLELIGTVHFGRVAVKPGLPLTYATVAGVPVIGLPGNPVSTLVGFEVVVRPVLRMLAHRAARWRPERQVTLRHAIRHAPDRLEFQRARLERDGDAWWATTTGSQASSRLLSLIGANALLRIPRGTGDLPAGARVSAIMMDEPESVVAP